MADVRVRPLMDIPSPEPDLAGGRLLRGTARSVLVYDVKSAPGSEGRQAAVVQFERCLEVLVASRHDDGFANHSLRPQIGLHTQVEVLESPWLFEWGRVAGAAERVMTGQRHFVFSFADDTFECIASHYIVVGVFPLLEAIESAVRIAFPASDRD